MDGYRHRSWGAPKRLGDTGAREEEPGAGREKAGGARGDEDVSDAVAHRDGDEVAVRVPAGPEEGARRCRLSFEGWLAGGSPGAAPSTP